MDIKDITILLAQAFNNQDQIYLISDEFNVNVSRSFTKICRIMNNTFGMHTSVVYSKYPGPIFRHNDLVIHVGYTNLRRIVESKCAFYINIEPHKLDYLISSVTNDLMDMMIRKDVVYG